jgi:hypothetical protein
MECGKNDEYIGFSCCHVCARKYANQLQGDIDRLTRENADLRAKLEEAVMLAGSYRNRKRSRNRKMIGGG